MRTKSFLMEFLFFVCPVLTQGSTLIPCQLYIVNKFIWSKYANISHLRHLAFTKLRLVVSIYNTQTQTCLHTQNTGVVVGQKCRRESFVRRLVQLKTQQDVDILPLCGQETSHFLSTTHKMRPGEYPFPRQRRQWQEVYTVHRSSNACTHKHILRYIHIIIIIIIIIMMIIYVHTYIASILCVDGRLIPDSLTCSLCEWEALPEGLACDNQF